MVLIPNCTKAVCLFVWHASQRVGGSRKPALKPKPPRSETPLGSTNAKLTAKSAKYRHALATQTELERLRDTPRAEDPDSGQALRNANKELSIAAGKYEDALREFTTFTDPHRRTG